MNKTRTMDCAQAHELIGKLGAQVRKVLIGQDEALDQVLCALVASGHVLVEGLPGLGKTLMVRALARAFGGDTRRVQFTPDLMPSDLVGHTMYDTASGTFSTRKGPVFTHILVADEINRAPAKTQAALLEVMQEYQVSLDGATHALERPFLVMATQNPYEHEGTYPLPDAQLDRFLLKVLITYPSRADEVSLAALAIAGKRGESLDIDSVEPVGTVADLQALQDACMYVAAAPQLVEYAVDIVAATRSAHGIRVGAGPRASLALLRLARARALQNGRDFVTPDDIKALSPPVLRHRIVLDPEWELGGGTSDDAVAGILARTDAPRA